MRAKFLSAIVYLIFSSATICIISSVDRFPFKVSMIIFPPISRDLNIVVDESVRWAEVEHTVRESGGELLESVAFQETWRDAKKLDVGKKSLLFSFQLRSNDATLTNERADAIRDKIVSALAEQVGGTLRT